MGNSFNQPEPGEPSLGTIHETPDSSRNSNWDINGVTDAAWTDRDFGAYCPKGVRMLYLKYALAWAGNGGYDFALAALRKNGSTVTDFDQLYTLEMSDVNRTNAVTAYDYGYVWVECDEDGVIESYVYGNNGVDRADGILYLQYMDHVI